MRLQKRKGTVDGYEWRCRNQSKDNRHDVVRSVRKGTWFSESKLAITIILRLTRYWFDKSMNEFVMNDLKVNKNITKLIRHMWRRSYDHKLVNENFHKFLASIARVYQPTDHDEMQANEKVSNHGSIPITIDCNVVAFIVFEEGFHQPIKRTKQSVFPDVTVFRHTVVD
ncbi:hypothetical protein TNCV_2295441 [Trichonephila clavipes]|nr:hypothetical protein TNCV_2295441 [Trichonephila clavipes]